MDHRAGPRHSDSYTKLSPAAQATLERLAKTRGHWPLAQFLHIGTSTLDRLFGAGTVKRATAERLEARLAELAKTGTT